MKLLFDTNVILDILLKRKEFYFDSFGSFGKALRIHDKVYIASTSINDIYYFLKKGLNDKQACTNVLIKLLNVSNVATVDEKVIYSAIISDLNDFEDSIISEAAKNVKANYIITRNTKDFKKSKIKAITPLQYLAL